MFSHDHHHQISERDAVEFGLKELDAGLSTDIDRVIARAYKIVDNADFRRRIDRFMCKVGRRE